MKKKFEQPCVEVINFEHNVDIITCSGGVPEDPGCGHGNHSGHNKPTWPSWPWWPWHW